MANHRRVKLGDIIKPRKEKAAPGDFPDAPFIGMEHVEAHTMRLLGTVPASTMRSNANRFYTDDVLYGRLRPYLNKVYKSHCDGLCSAEFIVFPKTVGIYPDFLRYRLNAHDFVSFASHLNTGDRPRVDFDGISSFEFFLPSSLEEQQSIVAAIDTQFSRLDEVVTALKRIQANLKRYKSAVLKAAVEGKLTEQWRKDHPDVEPADQLLKRILADRRARWEAEELAKMKAKGIKPKDDSWKNKYKEPAGPDMANLPELPEGWVWATVEQLTSLVTSGSRGWGDYYSDSGFLFIRAQDIKTDRLNCSNLARVDIPEKAEGTRSSVSNGDILVTITGANVTKSAIALHLQETAYVSQHVALLKPCIYDVSNFLYLWLVSPAHGRKILEDWAYGAGKPGLSLEQIRSLSVALSSLHEQQVVLEELDRCLSVTEELEAIIETNLKRAERLRQTILQRAFSGGEA